MSKQQPDAMSSYCLPTKADWNAVVWQEKTQVMLPSVVLQTALSISGQE
jgi:hypothetical protein